MDRTTSLGRIGFFGVLAGCLGGCASSPPPQPQALDRGAMVSEQNAEAGAGRGAGQIPVIVQNGMIRAELDRRHEVDQLIAAAEASLRSRGFTIDGNRNRLEEPLVVTGKMGGTPDSRRAEVSMLIGPTRVRIDVAIKPWGNDAEGRAVLKRMLELLGYGDR